MCGILSYSSKTTKFDENDIYLISVCNCFERGGDSTGFYSPENGLKKNTNKAVEYFYNKNNNLVPDKVLLGHFRKRSVGINNVENAHPYEYDNIVLVHNGTLTDYYKLGTKYEIPYNSWFTDSQLLGKIIDKTFKVGEFPKILNEYEGAASIVFYHKETGNIYAYRDGTRPLYYGTKDDGNSIIISSLRYTLEYVECDDIKEFPINILHEIKDGSIINTYNKPKSQEKIGFNLPATQTFNSYVQLAYNIHINKDYSISKLQWSYSFKGGNYYTGIVRSAVMAKMIKGYNLKYVGQTVRYKNNHKDNIKNANLTRDKYYTVVDNVLGSDTNFYTKDDEGYEKIVDLAYFDISNFIPTPGKYVKLVTDIYTTEGDQINVGNKGDYMLIKKHEFGQSNVASCISLRTGKSYSVDIELMHTISEYEYNMNKKQIEEALNKLDNKDSKEDDLPSPPSDNSCPWDIEEDKPEENKNIKNIEDDDEEDEDYNYNTPLTWETVANLILEIDIMVDDMIDLQATNGDVSDKLTELSGFLERAYNKKFLESLLLKNNG